MFQGLLKRSEDTLRMGDMLLDKTDIALINGVKVFEGIGKCFMIETRFIVQKP